tara:strand:- start:146 stop:1453 length:1308 start_codon:yes stop_codon:yes gene_type:complete
MISKLRIFSLVLIHILIFSHIYYFKDEKIGSIDFQEFFHAFIKSGILNAGTILVLIAFLTTLFFGRFFCGWACHFGAIQELSWWLLKKINIQPKTVDSKLVTILPIIILLHFYVWPNLWYAIKNPWSISIQLNQPEIWAFLPGWIIGMLTFLIDGFLIVYFLGRKGFCRFLCPWGAFLKIPNSLAMFKVRKVNTCTNCHNCTSNCPIGIDVNYEINTYKKVTNTNCTSCFLCIEGCPEKALAYQFTNPINEDIHLTQFLPKQKSIHTNIKNLFFSIRTKDIQLLFLTLTFGFCINELYGIGHFMAFGISLISSFFLINTYSFNKYRLLTILKTLLIIIFLTHGIIKYCIWEGLRQYENKNYNSSIKYLEFVINYYPKSIGRFHILLSMSYLENNDYKNALKHAEKASKINPNHKTPIKLINEIKEFKKSNYYPKF